MSACQIVEDGAGQMNDLVVELGALWQKSEGDYNAFEKDMRAAIARAFAVPAHYLERQVSFNRILTGEFTVETGRHGQPVIVQKGLAT